MTAVIRKLIKLDIVFLVFHIVAHLETSDASNLFVQLWKGEKTILSIGFSNNRFPASILTKAKLPEPYLPLQT